MRMKYIGEDSYPFQNEKVYNVTVKTLDESVDGIEVIFEDYSRFFSSWKEFNKNWEDWYESEEDDTDLENLIVSLIDDGYLVRLSKDYFGAYIAVRLTKESPTGDLVCKERYISKIDIRDSRCHVIYLTLKALEEAFWKERKNDN